MKPFVYVVFLLIGSTCLGQYIPLGAITTWTDGYVVTLQDDTLRGQVRVGSLVNDSPASIILRASDTHKVKLRGDDLRLVAQWIPEFSYSTGFIPRQREMVVFERVPNPRRNGKPMLLERLTPFGGSVALYFDAAGWKKTTEYTFGNFTVETDHQDFSYIVLKHGQESWVAKRGDMEVVHDKLFGDCPAFIRNYPSASRRSWREFGEMVASYNQLCSTD